MNIVLISKASRVDLLAQSITSLRTNAVNYAEHTLTLVLDNPASADGARACDAVFDHARPHDDNLTIISSCKTNGASASRNIGASSIPRYKRHNYVMFIDDDVYLCPQWDDYLIHVSNYFEPVMHPIISGHAHPYNHTVLRDSRDYLVTDVISTLHMYMSWKLWDDVGFFVEPGGPGGSEDVDYCRRATTKGYPLVITKPHRVIHCGLTSSSGKPIVGYSEMMKQNEELVQLHGLQNKVRFG